jgi:5,10-methylene-tetrahydrofolate dehydrogenase/methenyl tetrahydrofolate cyclohydrolase
MKAKAAAEASIAFDHITLDDNLSEREILEIVERVNGDPKVHGILVQLPLSQSVGKDGERRIVEAISPSKDVDGFVSSSPFTSFISSHLTLTFQAFTLSISVTYPLELLHLSFHPVLRLV